jgi:hypothetical protein
MDNAPEPSAGAVAWRRFLFGLPVVVLFWILCAWLKSAGVSFP